MISFLFNFLSKMSPDQLIRIDKVILALALSVIVTVSVYQSFMFFDELSFSKNEDLSCEDLAQKLLFSSAEYYEKHVERHRKRCG